MPNILATVTSYIPFYIGRSYSFDVGCQRGTQGGSGDTPGAKSQMPSQPSRQGTVAVETLCCRSSCNHTFQGIISKGHHTHSSPIWE